MKPEEAIDRIKWAKQRLDGITYSPETQEAFDMAIEALKEPKHGELDEFFEAFPELDTEPYNTWNCGARMKEGEAK